MRFDSLSKNIVQIMIELSRNDGLAKLLIHNEDNPFSSTLPVIDKTKLANPQSDLCRIHPFPFDPEAVTEDSSFIRVYYNDGEFGSNEVISETRLHIDIVVAKSLWLINDGEKSMIRPYEIMSRVIDMVGKRGLGTSIKLSMDGFQHLAVNTKFDAIRIYSEYFTVEA